MNIDLNAINYLNDEYTQLGLESIFTSQSHDSINYEYLFLNSIEILRRYRDHMQSIESLNVEKHRLNRLYESACKKQTFLQDSIEKKTKDFKLLEEKCRKHEFKIDTINRHLKEEQDDKKKLKQMIDQRDTLFKHDKKKVECELVRLKEKLSALVIAKSNVYSNIELNESIRKSSASRQTWDFINPEVQDNSKRQIEMYCLLIKDYERRNKELILENGEIRQLTSDIIDKIINLLIKHKIINKNVANNDLHSLVSLPWSNFNDAIEHFIKEYFQKLDETLEKSTKECFNTTFTVDSNDSNDQSPIYSVHTAKHSDDDDSKRIYLCKKLNMEEEKCRLDEALRKLSIERRQFEEEKTSFLKDNMYNSFNSSVNSSSTKK